MSESRGHRLRMDHLLLPVDLFCQWGEINEENQNVASKVWRKGRIPLALCSGVLVPDWNLAICVFTFSPVSSTYVSPGDQHDP